MKVTGAPLNFTDTCKASLPICSRVTDALVVAVLGNVIQIGAAHVLPVAVTVAPTIDWPSAE